MNGSVLIKRVVLKNYKSIASCSVELQPLIFLVGQNGSGKSNFLDALRLVSESLNSSLDHSLRERGGINEVRRRSCGHPTHFGIRLEFSLPDATSGYYAFRVGAKPKGGFEVQREECRVYARQGLQHDGALEGAGDPGVMPGVDLQVPEDRRCGYRKSTARQIAPFRHPSHDPHHDSTHFLGRPPPQRVPSGKLWQGG